MSKTNTRAKTLKTWIHGCSGKTGSSVTQSFRDSGDYVFSGGSGRNLYSSSLEKASEKTTSASLAAAFAKEQIDLIVDFSGAEGNELLLEAFESDKELQTKNILIASTGLSERILSRWKKIGESKSILFAPNTSMGILVMKALLQKAIPILRDLGFDMDVREAHHVHKLDSPSGTTKSLLEEYWKAGIEKEKVGVHVERWGGVFGLHSALFTSEAEEVGVSHQAFHRKLFGDGSLVLAKWLGEQPAGVYQLNDVGASILPS